MKNLFIFNLLFIISISSTISMANIKNKSEKKPLGILHALMQDTYTFSEKINKYSLSTSQFKFKIFSQSNDGSENNLLDQGSITDTPKTVNRLLFISSTKAHFEFIDGVGQKKLLVVKSDISQNQEKMSIRFSEESKNDILKKIISTSGMLVNLDKTNISSSSYNCKVTNKKLVCSVNYVLKSIKL